MRLEYCRTETCEEGNVSRGWQLQFILAACGFADAATGASTLALARVCASQVKFGGRFCVPVARRRLLLAVWWLKGSCLSDSVTPDVSGPAQPQERVGADRPLGPLLFPFVLF